MNGYKYIIIGLAGIIFAFSIHISASVSAQTNTDAVQNPIPIISLTSAVVDPFIKSDPYTRDSFLRNNLNKIIETVVVVQNVEKSDMFRRGYCIYAKTVLAGKVTLFFHIYTENQEYSNLLSEGTKFSFKGQFLMFTPLNSKRDAYIIDVALEDGGVVVD